MEHSKERREFLKWVGLAGASLLASGRAAAGVVRTPPQTEGPFFPVREPADTDADLTRVEGHDERADGEVVVVRVRIADLEGRPLSGALLDVWQACATGRYNHPDDRNRAELDPHFQYWARLQTGEDGACRFTTIVPGAYALGWFSRRTPHIHFRIDAQDHPRLTTQMYFEGQELNEQDAVLAETAERYGGPARDSLIVDFTSEMTDEGHPQGTFGVVLGRTPETG